MYCFIILFIPYFLSLIWGPIGYRFYYKPCTGQWNWNILPVATNQDILADRTRMLKFVQNIFLFAKNCLVSVSQHFLLQRHSVRLNYHKKVVICHRFLSSLLGGFDTRKNIYLSLEIEIYAKKNEDILVPCLDSMWNRNSNLKLNHIVKSRAGIIYSVLKFKISWGYVRIKNQVCIYDNICSCLNIVHYSKDRISPLIPVNTTPELGHFESLNW